MAKRTDKVVLTIGLTRPCCYGESNNHRRTIALVGHERGRVLKKADVTSVALPSDQSSSFCTKTDGLWHCRHQKCGLERPATAGLLRNICIAFFETSETVSEKERKLHN